MNKPFRKVIALLLIFAVSITFSGCWDEHELDTLFIVTGIAIDNSQTPDQIDVTVQIGKPKSKSSSSESDSSGGQSSSVIIIKTTEATALEGLKTTDRDSSRTLLFQHNQVVLFSSEFAAKGVRNRFDLFLRDNDMRMEVLLIVTAGRADQFLTANLSQEDISGIFIARVMQDLKAVSPYLQIRLLDFASRLQEKTSSPLAPIAVLNEVDGKQNILIEGTAVFKNDRMIGKLDVEQSRGYLFTMGKVKHASLTAQSQYGRAVFNIEKLDTKRNVTLRPDGGVKVTLSVVTSLGIGELRGFSAMNPKDLMTELKSMAQQQITNQISDTFAAARSLDADIYGFGTSVYQKYPKAWESMEGDWDVLFKDIQLDIKVNVRIPQTGKVIKSLEMDVNSRAN